MDQCDPQMPLNAPHMRRIDPLRHAMQLHFLPDYTDHLAENKPHQAALAPPPTLEQRLDASLDD